MRVLATPCERCEVMNRACWYIAWITSVSPCMRKGRDDSPDREDPAGIVLLLGGTRDAEHLQLRRIDGEVSAERRVNTRPFLDSPLFFGVDCNGWTRPRCRGRHGRRASMCSCTHPRVRPANIPERTTRMGIMHASTISPVERLPRLARPRSDMPDAKDEGTRSYPAQPAARAVTRRNAHERNEMTGALSHVWRGV